MFCCHRNRHHHHFLPMRCSEFDGSHVRLPVKHHGNHLQWPTAGTELGTCLSQWWKGPKYHTIQPPSQNNSCDSDNLFCELQRSELWKHEASEPSCKLQKAKLITISYKTQQIKSCCQKRRLLSVTPSMSLVSPRMLQPNPIQLSSVDANMSVIAFYGEGQSQRPSQIQAVM